VRRDRLSRRAASPSVIPSEIAGTFRYGLASIGTNAASIVLDSAGAAIENGSRGNALAAFASNAAAGSLELKNRASLASSAAVANAGTLTVGAGSSFQSSGNYAQSAGSTLVDGSLTATAGQVVLNGGGLSGAGTIAPALNNAAGTVAPGSSPGILTVNGSYTQGKSATLRLELNGLTLGSQYDRLAVTGAATLAGTLQLQTGFAPRSATASSRSPSPRARAASNRSRASSSPTRPTPAGWSTRTRPTSHSRSSRRST
jgi:fibronectin-binding autotransporter adhesin